MMSIEQATQKLENAIDLLENGTCKTKYPAWYPPYGQAVYMLEDVYQLTTPTSARELETWLHSLAAQAIEIALDAWRQAKGGEDA